MAQNMYNGLALETYGNMFGYGILGEIRITYNGWKHNAWNG